MLYLYLEAPFAVFRNFSAGSFRPTAPFMTFSAAYGLLLNLAGIEMREDDSKSVMTRIKSGLPAMKLALGEVEPAQRHVLYQQLHNYPVGNQGKERALQTKGSKYNIVPARRAFLSGLKISIGIQAGADVEEKIVLGLRGEEKRAYGLPFLGDNNLLPDRIELLERLRPAHWILPVSQDDDPATVTEPMRLTVTIDRSDMSRTVAPLFRVDDKASKVIPEPAWIAVSYG